MVDRDKQGRFTKGHAASNNGKGGPPPGLRMRAQAATHDGQDIIAFFVAIASDPLKPDSLRMEAYAWLADRGWGKPVQSIEHSGPNQGPILILEWHDGSDAADPPA